MPVLDDMESSELHDARTALHTVLVNCFLPHDERIVDDVIAALEKLVAVRALIHFTPPPARPATVADGSAITVASGP
jgi:hypothetical protein